MGDITGPGLNYEYGGYSKSTPKVLREQENNVQSFGTSYVRSLKKQGYKLTSKPGARYREWSKTISVPGKKWTGKVDQYIPDPVTGGWKENLAFRKGMSGKDPLTGRNITYSNTFNGAIPLSKAALTNKMPTDSEYLSAKASTDTVYNSDVNQRQRNLDMTNLDYGQNKAKLAQSRVRDLAGIDNRAARLGVGFSQGRLTARDNYDTNFNDNAQRAQSSNTIANAQFFNQNVDAQANRVDALRTVGLNVVNRLQSEDDKNVLANKGTTYQPTTNVFQHVDTKGHYRLGPKGKRIYA